MPLYRVRPGFTHGAAREYKGGDLVELPEVAAAGFSDKLEPVAASPVSTPSDGVDRSHSLAGENRSPHVERGEEAREQDGPERDAPGADPWRGLNNALVRLLAQADYATPEAVRAAADSDLLAISGIGPKALELIREKLGG